MTNIFEEIEKMEQDKDFVKTNFPNQFNLGVVLIDITKFKTEVAAEIEAKIKIAKNLLLAKCEDVYNSVEKLNEEMHKLLD